MMHPTMVVRRAFGIIRQNALRWILNTAVAQTFMVCAYPQYLFDPSNADEQTPGIRYFGSAKDEKGVLMPGVTVFIEYGSKSFVFVTDDQGRFRGFVPLTLPAPDKSSSKCSRPGYQLVSATERPGLNAPKPYVQVDCVLRLATPG